MGEVEFRLRMMYASLDPYAGTESKAVVDEYDVQGIGNACTVETFADFYVPDNGVGGTGAVSSLGTGVIVTVLTSESGPKPLLAGEAAAPRVTSSLLRCFFQSRYRHPIRSFGNGALRVNRRTPSTGLANFPTVPR